jgi:DNA-binding response OmpR family regulator
MAEKIKILIVDDEKDFCFFVSKNLTHTEKFDAFIAHIGKDGLKLAQSELPDLILLDLVMPGMSGEDVAVELADMPETENIPITFLTALVTRGDAGEGVLKKIGAKYFIVKPVRTRELINALMQRLGHS